MIDGAFFVVVFAGALLCGLTAGALYAFSTFVMRALVSLPPPQGVAAMQAVNRTALSPWVMVAFAGGAVLSAVIVGFTLVSWPGSTGVLLLAGAGLYLFGTLGLSAVAHFPRNDALAEVDPAGPDTAGYWRTWAREWTRANHVRTGAALASCALYVLALAR
ncbi:anthrone oxygenase family protein [Streptomyces sp. NPDC005955]|jgi:uncharacterized membrane protein|uniref:anthrone oxygenase family protein n=1 Tax=Streptomyces sp. NPDC005955 TaxID=3364738 RepID=UPI003695FC29